MVSIRQPPAEEGIGNSFVKPISLMYHDIIENGIQHFSGFPMGKMLYKIDVGVFREHLEAIARKAPGSVVAIGAPDFDATRPLPVLLTFDDGGAGAMLAAEILDRHGWKGHFFIATDWIGRSGFLEKAQIRELSHAGHVVGSHSCSHPERMSCLDINAMQYEWSESIKRLGEILQKAVRTASVPNGYYSARVARTASLAGVRVLFTSEPTARLETVYGCTVIGRYTIRRNMSAALIGSIAAGERRPRVKQAAVWQFKKIAKNLGGEFYLKFRDRILANH